MEKYIINKILTLLKKKRSFDFTGNRLTMLERRIQKRVFATKSGNFENYFEYLNIHKDELDHLINVLTINVSNFFRNSISFEYLNKVVIPDLFLAKAKANDKSLRIWSAGCAFGEEPYSMAIIMKEFLSKADPPFNLRIFATDIDKQALKRASIGSYVFNNIENVKYGTVHKYFTKKGEQFEIDSEIKKMVRFSFYDLLSEKHSVPPDSIFGGFDIILCRNVLIYFDPNHQRIIFNKLYKSLKLNGYLMLGESEVPVEKFKNRFKKENKCCKIYRKIS